MVFKLNREAQPKGVKSVTLEINDSRYRISETIDGRLKINKVSIGRGEDDYIRVHPVSGNEIDIS